MKPKLLFLSQTLPYPPDGGVKIRTYHILRLLAEAFDVHALCFYRWKAGLVQQDIGASLKALTEIAKAEAFPIPQEHNRTRLLLDHASSLFTGRVYTAYVYRSSRYKKRLAELLANRRFDVVHADSLDLSAYFPWVEHMPLVCVHHDAQSVLLRRRAKHEKNGARQAYLRLQSRLMAREERYWCPRVTLNVAVSEVDRDALRSVAGSGRFAVVPNGVDTSFFSPRSQEVEGVVFVGGTSWFPNRDALQYFAAEIAPLLRARGVKRLRWVGRTTPGEQRDFARQGLDLTGYVEDIRPHVAEAGCYIVPLRIGGGTRLKILDAWAMGKAVVSTSIGCEGLDVVDGRNILIRDSPHSFTDAVLEVLNDEQLRERLGAAGRTTAEERYSWNAIGGSMIEVYSSLLRPRDLTDG